MRLAQGLLVPLLLAVSAAGAHDKCTAADCAAVKAKIKNIEARMRAGYTRAQGERYEARLRELKAKRRKLCR